MLELGTPPSENIRNVCSLSEPNHAKFECKTDANHSGRIAELTNFRLVAWKALKNAKLSFRSIKSD